LQDATRTPNAVAAAKTLPLKSFDLHAVKASQNPYNLGRGAKSFPYQQSLFDVHVVETLGHIDLSAIQSALLQSIVKVIMHGD
jgi:hypothetical protein